MSGPEPPRGPIRSSLQDRASQLIEDAFAEAQRAKALEKSGRPSRQISVLVLIGLLLISVEVLSLGALFLVRSAQITTRNPEPNPLLRRNDCRGEIYRTYRKIMAYSADHDGQLPDTLADLVGRYSTLMPADPQTGFPLRYAKNGARLLITCKPPGDAGR